MKTKLILVEGLPGSGKSTTAEMIHNILDDLGVDNEFFYEGNLDHPADYDGVASFGKRELQNLLKTFKSQEDKINDITYKGEEGYFIAYKKGMKRFGDKLSSEFYHACFKKDIYELPLDRHTQLLRGRWTEFVQKANKEDKVYVFDCPFIQNPVTVTLIRENKDESVIFDYIRSLEEIINKLNPILIYVDQQDMEAAFKKVVRERPKEWLDGFISYYTDQGYGKANHLQGLEGTIKVLKERKKIEANIVKHLNMKTYSIDNSDFNKAKLKEEIKAILNINL